jgi:hypothetical protein
MWQTHDDKGQIMARSNADLLALKAEITNDPKALGLVAPPAVDDVGNADKLNLVRETLLIDREAIPVTEVMVQIDRDEFAALSAADRAWLQMISTTESVNPKTGGEVREGLLQLFGAASESRANLLSILQEPANRVEQMLKEGLLEEGGTVTASDIANARNAV